MQSVPTVKLNLPNIPELKRVNLPLALGLAKAGAFVFPANENKQPCVKWREGSTRDEEEICRLWSQFPTAAPAIDCGKTGVVAVDADVHKSGPEKLGAWLAERDIDVSTIPKTVTQSGGVHLFAPNAAGLGCAKGGFTDLGCDIKGVGGYVLAPGALLPNGQRYQPAAGHPELAVWLAGLDQDLDATPAWITETIGAAANAPTKENPTREAELIARLIKDDWPNPIEVLDPTLGGFDLEALKAKDKRLRDLLETGVAINQRTGEPMSHSEALWHLSLSLHAEYGESFNVLDFAALIQHLNDTEGLPSNGAFGVFVGEVSPRVGEFDYRQIARSFMRGENNRFITEGAALIAVHDEEEAEPPKAKVKAKRALQFEMFDAVAEAALVEADKPLIAGLLDEEAMSVLYGESNAGKSFVALDISFHVATDRKWNDRETSGGLVIYIAAEGGKRFARRVAALRKHYGDDAKGAAFALVRSTIDLRSRDGDAKAIIDLVREAERSAGEKAALVVVDTLSRAMAGGDENSSIDMGALVNNCDRIREATGAHLMIVHHTGKDRAKGARGHSLLRAATDTELEVVDSTIVTRKQRDLEFANKIAFSLRDVDLGVDAGGHAHKSAVVTLGAASPQSAKVEAAQALRGNQLELFSVIKAMAAERAAVAGCPAHAIELAFVEVRERLEARRKADGAKELGDNIRSVKRCLIAKGVILEPREGVVKLPGAGDSFEAVDDDKQD